MAKRCLGCQNKIKTGARICSHCGAYQSRFSIWLNASSGFVTLLVSVLSLIVSVFAIYFSIREEEPLPKLFVQFNRFNPDDFALTVSNLGQLPTVIEDINLKMTFELRGHRYTGDVWFEIDPTLIATAESRLLKLPYDSFLPHLSNFVSSGSSDDLIEDFRELRIASALGGNLDCKIFLSYSSRRSFPHNFDMAQATVNGQCVDAMRWYAKARWDFIVETPK